MPIAHEDKVHVVEAYVAAFSRGAADEVVALFAENATVEDPVGSELIEGREAIQAFYERSMKTGAKLKLSGPVRTPTDHAVFPFAVHLEFAGANKRIDVIDIFRFDEGGKIVRMEAYWSPENMVDA